MGLLLALSDALHARVQNSPDHNTHFLELVQLFLSQLRRFLQLFCLLVEGFARFVLVPGFLQPSLKLFREMGSPRYP